MNSTKRKALLSAPLILEEGLFQARYLSLFEAKKWVEENQPDNYCGHDTVRLLGIEPALERRTCPGYDAALAVKAAGRLEFGRAYSQEEITAAGIKFTLIEKVQAEQ